MDNPLAVFKDVPDYLKAEYSQNARYAESLGQLEASDFTVNFIKLVHPLSKEARAHWGPRGDEPAMALDTMFLSRDHLIIPVGSKCIPLWRKKTYIKWIGVPGNGQMEFMTDHKDDRRIRAIDGLAFVTGPDGKRKPPIVTEYINYYVLTNVSEEPAVLSFYRTGIPLGRRLTQLTNEAMEGGHYPMHSLLFTFSTPTQKKNPAGNVHPQFSIQPAGFVPEDILPKAKKAAEMAKILANAATTAQFSAIENDGTEQKTVHVVETAPQESQPPFESVPPTVVAPDIPKRTEAIVTPPPPQAQAPAAQAPAAPAPAAQAPAAQAQTPAPQAQPQPKGPEVSKLW